MAAKATAAITTGGTLGKILRLAHRRLQDDLDSACLGNMYDIALSVAVGASSASLSGSSDTCVCASAAFLPAPPTAAWAPFRREDSVRRGVLSVVVSGSASPMFPSAIVLRSFLLSSFSKTMTTTT